MIIRDENAASFADAFRNVLAMRPIEGERGDREEHKLRMARKFWKAMLVEFSVDPAALKADGVLVKLGLARRDGGRVVYADADGAL